MAALHWAFMDRSDTQAVANQRVTAVTLALCPGCATPCGNQHPHLSSQWYSTHFCAGGQRIPTRAALHGAVEVGDVPIVGVAIQAPVHSMLVVNKRSLGGHSSVYIRGFNNVGTLGTGAQLQYDAHDRDIDRAALWHGAGDCRPSATGRGTTSTGYPTSTSRTGPASSARSVSVLP
jgi:hypothetical protein